MKIVETLISRWENQGMELIPGVPVSAIETTFASLQYKATADIVNLYSKIGGMYVMENDAYWRFWPLSEIVERNTETSPYGAMFSDHLMDSWCYRLKYETDFRSSVYIDHFNSKILPEKLFDGLEDFFNAYAKNPHSILG